MLPYFPQIVQFIKVIITLPCIHILRNKTVLLIISFWVSKKTCMFFSGRKTYKNVYFSMPKDLKKNTVDVRHHLGQVLCRRSLTCFEKLGILIFTFGRNI